MVGRLVGAGRGLAVEPVFESGPPLRLGRQGRMGAMGDLVTAVAGRGSPRIVAVHGPARSARAAMAALLASEGLGRPFGRVVNDAADEVASRDTASDRGRRDMTHQRVITIDPEGAKDHDDAIAVARDGDDITLWVHIADVSAFVDIGGVIDREAARRGNSVYLPGLVDPMLPRRLSNDICSLRPGEDRAAVTAELAISPDGEVRRSSFFRSTIHSRRRLTYPEVDRLFAGGTLDDQELEADIALAREAAERLRARRRSRGALEIEGAEPSFTFTDEGRVAGIELEIQTASHRLIEDCMIAANEAVAQHLLARGHAGVYRHHAEPAERSVMLLVERLEALGVALPPIPDEPLTPTECERVASIAAEAITRHVAVHGGARGLPVLVLQSLRQAFYAVDHMSHSGLASAAYLHFTSPIRRYPDLLVHRALLDSLGIGPASEDLGDLTLAAERSSLTEREAVALERRADRICRAFLTEDLVRTDPDRVFPGEITGVGEGGVFVAFGDRLELDGYLPARSIDGDWYHADPLGILLEGEETGRRLALGDSVEVRVVSVEPLRGRVELMPVDGIAPAPRPAPRGRGRRDRPGRGR